MPPAQTPALGCFPKKGHLGSPFCQSHTHFLQVGVTGAFTGQRKGVLGRGHLRSGLAVGVSLIIQTKLVPRHPKQLT